MGLALRVTPAGTWLTVHRRLSVGLRLGPRRSMNLEGKICIVSYVRLSVSSFGIFRSLFYILNLFRRSFSLYGNQKSSQKLLQVFQVVLSKSRIFDIFRFLEFICAGLALRVSPAGTRLTVHRRL